MVEVGFVRQMFAAEMWRCGWMENLKKAGDDRRGSRDEGTVAKPQYMPTPSSFIRKGIDQRNCGRWQIVDEDKSSVRGKARPCQCQWKMVGSMRIRAPRST